MKTRNRGGLLEGVLEAAADAMVRGAREVLPGYRFLVIAEAPGDGSPHLRPFMVSCTHDDPDEIDLLLFRTAAELYALRQRSEAEREQ